MTEWFKTAFGEDYLSLYAHRDASEAARAVDLILGFTKLAAGSRILDAPCGAGRHLAVFRSQRMKAVGFDLSRSLLREAVGDPDIAGRVVQSDIRNLPFPPACCDMVVNLFSSFGYFSSDQENLKVLSTLVGLVRNNGWFILDFMHSRHVAENLVPESQRTIASGLMVCDRRWIDGPSQRVNKTTQLTYPGGRTQTLNESVRLFTPEELRSALEINGILVEAEFGSYEGVPFTGDSSRIIFMGRTT